MSLLAAIHLLSYSTLLGSTLYQSFVMTKVCFTALPRPAFTTLQQKVFPVYFKLQTGLLLATALTYPGPSLASVAVVDAGLLAFAGAMAVANWLRYGPATSDAMVARTHQGRRRSSQSGPRPVESEEMKAKKKRAFSRNHAMSIHLNLLLVVAVLAYGVRLSSKANF